MSFLSATTTVMVIPTPFDVFFEAHIPAVDPVMSQHNQSIFLELAFWCVGYMVYGAVVSEWLRHWWSKSSYWDFFKQKFGVFCWNAQDDVVLMNMLGIHHTVAGGMCVMGQLLGDWNLWKHGYMIEVGFEIADVLSMNPFYPMYPYRHDNMRLDAYVKLLFHHVPCIITGVFVFQCNLQDNPIVHGFCFWCLIGAAASMFGAIFVESRDLDKRSELIQATLPLVVNVGFWYYCRFYRIRLNGYEFLDYLRGHPVLKDHIFTALLPYFYALLTVFNALVLLDGIHRCVRYTMRCIDGVTEVEKGEVPLSREDRWKKERKLKSV